MTLSDLFRSLGAPLTNIRWSWGSVRASDGTVFLRVWQDGVRKIGGKRYVWVADAAEFDSSAGAKERHRQIQLIEAGASSLMVMCKALDTAVLPRVVETFNRTELFVGGEVAVLDGTKYLEIVRRVPVSDCKV